MAGIIASMTVSNFSTGLLRRRLRERLLHWPWLATLQTLRLRFAEARLGQTAGSLTFTTLISLVPLLTVALALFTAFPIFASFQQSLEQYFLKSLIPPNIAKPVLGALTQFAAKANHLGLAGLVVLGGTALALMFTIDRTLNTIWRVKRPRPMVQRVLVYWAALTLGPLLLGGSLTLTGYAISAGKGLMSDMSGDLRLLFRLVELLVLWVAVAGLFHYVPNTHVRWRHALAGGLFVALAFDVAKSLLAWYVKQVPTYSTLYGAFAAVPIFLVWLYLGWVIMLVGALIAANLPALSGRMLRRPESPGLGLELALEAVRALWQARQRGEPGLSAQSLAQRLRVDPLQLEPSLDALLALDWLGRLEEAGEQRLVLLCEPAQTLAAPLLQQLLARRGGSLSPLWQRGDWARCTLVDLLGVEHHE
jgi:membrane protein